ncbi:flavin reductase family protein [Aeromicrobium sp. Leaf350]|uniref:flavin reductase family protein n=1 Tax=Aeromicrobium sp. Leaf350 TaxID=2876565 RepID=UPI001E39476E|nr:flavin reductase family protein [Aeromicrobium sp. Leaf350]
MIGAGGARADGAAWLRQAFRLYPSGVAIVTAATPEGPVGLTVSSLASVSAEPPVLSFSLSSATRSAAALLEASEVAVHVLPARRAELAADFARSGAPRFTPEQGWLMPAGAPPRLPDAVVSLVGPVRDRVPVADSVLVLVDVTSTLIGPPSAPLLHLDRGFRSVGPPATPVAHAS